jgi:threonylcarbamoyladenosine tRNA methylthiotransferase MtaB
MHGFTDNYIRVELPADETLDNCIIPVRLGGFNADRSALLGTIVAD